MNELAKDLLFTAVYHGSIEYEAIPEELIADYEVWAKEYERLIK